MDLEFAGSNKNEIVEANTLEVAGPTMGSWEQ